MRCGMAGKQSWAEGRWWRGTVFDWLGVLLAVAIVFVLAFVSIPFFLVHSHKHLQRITALRTLGVFSDHRNLRAA